VAGSLPPDAEGSVPDVVRGDGIRGGRAARDAVGSGRVVLVAARLAFPVGVAAAGGSRALSPGARELLGEELRGARGVGVAGARGQVGGPRKYAVAQHDACLAAGDAVLPGVAWGRGNSGAAAGVADAAAGAAAARGPESSAYDDLVAAAAGVAAGWREAGCGCGGRRLRHLPFHRREASRARPA
jgi:hypothetical protein